MIESFKQAKQALATFNSSKTKRPRDLRGRLRASPKEASDRFLEFLGGAEGHLLRRLDLDGFAGGGIATHTRRTPTDLQDAQAGHAHLVALLQVLDSEVDKSAEEFRR